MPQGIVCETLWGSRRLIPWFPHLCPLGKSRRLTPAGQPGPSGTEAMPRLRVVRIALRVFYLQVRMRGEWVSLRPWALLQPMGQARGRSPCCFGTPLAAIAPARCLVTPFPENGGPHGGLEA